MITNHADAIVSLLSTGNIIMLTDMIKMEYITTDQLCTGIIRWYTAFSTHNPDVVVALINASDIDNEETIQCMIDMLPDRLQYKRIWDTDTMNAFTKLVDLGGKLEPDRIACLPRDAYVYYTEANDFAISPWVAQSINHGRCHLEIVELLHQKIESEITSLEQSSLLAYIIPLIREGKCTDVVLQEIYDRQLFDTLFVCLLHSNTNSCVYLFFDEHVSKCENADVFIFYRSFRDAISLIDYEWSPAIRKAYIELSACRYVYDKNFIADILTNMKKIMELSAAM